MLITKVSVYSGETHTLDIPVTQEQLDDWRGGTLIQDAMPNLSPEYREFLMTEITPGEWAEALAQSYDDFQGGDGHDH